MELIASVVAASQQPEQYHKREEPLQQIGASFLPVAK